MGWPQWIYLLVTAAFLLANVGNHGDTGKVNVVPLLVTSTIYIALLFWGGFFT